MGRGKELCCWEYMLCTWCEYETLHRDGECMHADCLEPRKRLEKEVAENYLRNVKEAYQHKND